MIYIVAVYVYHDLCYVYVSHLKCASRWESVTFPKLNVRTRVLKGKLLCFVALHSQPFYDVLMKEEEEEEEETTTYPMVRTDDNNPASKNTIVRSSLAHRYHVYTLTSIGFSAS